ncbi:protein kinase domain-containing protein [Candidatus Laterigemmans baculatus]|uniref:protein kinase domain-containing protein n=1 Tax=Candidatus Laterigemmans baculatus TaxID=2770505 RepID=UPI0013DCBE53|nr:protein kinase [Candidatus Laterigemmans baculatus]
MIATECPPPEELRALSTGRLADERSDELLEHLRGCEPCRSAIVSVADGEDSLVAALRSPEAPPAFDGEPGYRLALAKALGALAAVGDTTSDGVPTELPRAIGEYELVRPLGSGGMGSVFLARHTKLGREVAVKVLAGHRLGDPRMRERFDAEMRAVGKLHHPNIVTAHDAREVDGTAVLVTEYIDGLDLSELVARTGPLTVADACEIARQVAVALAYTHSQGFVHRDVKPSNIMLSRRGEVKLLDLGLARLQFDELESVGMTGTGQTMGTADYVAPEQVADSRSVDVRADIYSLGCTLFKLLCGSAPFADAEHLTAFAKMTAHVSEPPPSLADRLPDAPAGLVRLIAAMLAKEPRKRPQTPQAVAERLTAFTQGAELGRLAERAEALEPAKPLPQPASPSTRPSSPPTLPLLRRPIALWIALASGVAGMLLGAVLGILLTIEYPDGTTVRLEAPAGSRVTIGDATSGEADSDTAPATHTEPLSNAAGIPPLQFAILAEPNLKDEAVRAAIDKFLTSDKNRPVATEIGTWYPLSAANFPLASDGRLGLDSGMMPMGIAVAPGPNEPLSLFHNGQRYVLARNDSAGMIGWETIEGHVAATVTKQNDINRIELNFDEALFAKLNQLAEASVQRQIAIILGGKVIAAPVVHAGLKSSQAILEGDLSDEQIKALIDAIRGVGSGSEPIRKSTADPMSKSFKEFQGIWRVSELRVNVKEVEDAPETVWAFDGKKFYVANANTLTGGGTFDLRIDAHHHRITLRNERIEFGTDATVPGVYSVRPDGKLALSLKTSRDSTGTHQILTRIGDIPENLRQLQAILKGKNHELAQAIVNALKPAGFAEQDLPTTPVAGDPKDSRGAATPGKLRQLGLAFHNFYAPYGKFPGSTNVLEGARHSGGKTKLEPFSWRVAILPFIGENELFDQYRFDEPWDSEHNRTLLTKMPEVYRSPLAEGSDKPTPAGETHFQGFVGEQTALGTGGGLAMREFRDGTSNTLLIVESQASVPWTKPEDLRFEKPEDAKAIKPFDDSPLYYLNADGAAHEMDPVDWEKLAKLITRNGGEVVRP